MKKIIIVGAGGFGREAYYLIKDINRVNPTWDLVGFLDDARTSLQDKKIDTPVLSTIDDWTPSDDEYYVLGIASPKTKETVVDRLKRKGIKNFATLISPLAIVNETAIIGKGCVISALSSIGDCSEVGNFVNVAGTAIGQDVIVGDYTTTTAYVNIPNSKVGKRCFIGSHSVIFGTLDDDVEVVAGSVVFHRVKKGTKVMGYPAKKIEL